MAEKLTRQFIAEKAIVHAEPTLLAPAVAAPAQVDRSFELPTRLYAATAGLFLAYVALMGVGFANPGMILPVAIFAVFIVAGFTVPALWTRLAPDSGQRPIAWERFCRDGIMTLTGRCKARDATVQVLIMPVMIFAWGVTVVTIAALVR